MGIMGKANSLHSFKLLLHLQLLFKVKFQMDWFLKSPFFSYPLKRRVSVSCHYSFIHLINFQLPFAHQLVRDLYHSHSLLSKRKVDEVLSFNLPLGLHLLTKVK